jgi:hypothetical protein
MPVKLRPMSEFDPTREAFVHDKLNDRVLRWEPEWAAHYQEHAITEHREGRMGRAHFGRLAARMPLRSVNRSPGVVGNSSVEGGMSDGNTGRCRDDPSKMLPVLIPQLYAKRQVAGNVMQVGVRQFA